MADPGTLALTSAVATGAKGGLGVFSSLMEGESKSKQLQYQAGIARINKQIALQNADYTRRVGEVGAQTEGMKTRFQIAQTRTVQSGRGIDIGSGSAALVQESEHDIGLHDMATIRANAAHRAYGYEVEAAQDEAQAKLYEMGAEQAKTAGKIGAVSSILGSATSVADKWYQYGQVFGGPGGGSDTHHLVPYGT